MSIMFSSNFTFSHPRSPSLESNDPSSTRATSRSVSPCSPPTAAFPPLPSYSVTDLAARFAGSRLRQDAQIYYDSCASYANMDDDDARWEIPSSVSAETTHYSPASRRLQRQVSTRMLCSSGSHHKDIAALVSKMVNRRDQCAVAVSSSSPSSSNNNNNVENEDEGYTSSSDDAQASSSVVATANSRLLGFRRSSELGSVGGGACVSKAVRFRKEGKGRRISRMSE